MTQWGERYGTLFGDPTVRDSDSPSIGFHAAMTAPIGNWTRDVVRDPGNYVGVHRLSYSWALNYIGRKWFRTNVGMSAR